MVKTTLVKLKDEQGKEYASIFGDLTELHEEVEATILACEKVSDLAEGLFSMKRFLEKLIQDSVKQYEDKKTDNTKDSNGEE